MFPTSNEKNLLSSNLIPIHAQQQQYCDVHDDCDAASQLLKFSTLEACDNENQLQQYSSIDNKNKHDDLIRLETNFDDDNNNNNNDDENENNDDKSNKNNNSELKTSKKRSKNSSKSFEMNLYTSLDLDPNQPIVPCQCKFNVTKLELSEGLKDLNSVYLVVKMNSRKRSLRTNEIQLKRITSGGEDRDDLCQAELNLNYTVIYPYYLSPVEPVIATTSNNNNNNDNNLSKDNSSNLLNLYLQQRKKYKNRTILGFKTIAHSQIDLNSIMDKKIATLELPIVSNVPRSRKPNKKNSENTNGENSESSKMKSQQKQQQQQQQQQRDSQQLVGHLTIKSLACQLIDSDKSNLKLSEQQQHQQQTLNKIIKNRQVKLLRKELKLLKTKATNSKKLLLKKEPNYKLDKLSNDQQNVNQESENVPNDGDQRHLQVQKLSKKPKFMLSLNRRSNFTFSDSDDVEIQQQQNQLTRPFKMATNASASVASALVTTVANNTSSIIAQATSSTKKTSTSTISAIRRSIINSSNNFASNTANKNAKKLTGKFISFIKKFRNDSDENENDIEDGFEDELDGETNLAHSNQLNTIDNGDISKEKPINNDFDNIFENNNNHMVKMDLLKDQINNIIINDYDNFNDQDFEDDDDLNNYDLDNIEQVSNQISDDERDDATDHQDVYSIISTPKPKLLPFFTKSQQELNYKHIMEEYQIKDNYLISISNSKLDKSSIDKLSYHLNDKSSDGSNNQLAKSIDHSTLPNEYKKSKIKYETTMNLLTVEPSKKSSKKSKSNLKSSSKHAKNSSISEVYHATNEEKLEKVLSCLIEKRFPLENEYLFLIIDQNDSLNLLLRENLKDYENISYFEYADSLSDLKQSINRVLSWLIRNETILINSYGNNIEKFLFKVLIIGNDQFMNRYLQAYVDLFKEDNEFIYLKYFKHFYVPSNSSVHSSSSTSSSSSSSSSNTNNRNSLKLASILFSSDSKNQSSNKKESGLYKKLFGDDQWFSLIKKIQNKKSLDVLNFNEIWSRLSRYVCSTINDPSFDSMNLNDVPKEDFRLHIGQVDIVFNGQKFSKLQLPFLFDIKISSCDVSNINELNLIDNENSENFVIKKAKLRTKSMIASNSLSDFDKLKRKQQIESLDQSNSNSTTKKQRDTFISDFPIFLSPQIDTFQNLKNQFLNMHNSQDSQTNIEESSLRNEFKLHIEYSYYDNSELKSLQTNQQQSSVTSIENQFSNIIPLSSSLTLPNFSNSKWLNSNFKQLNLIKSMSSNSKFIQIYRTNLFKANNISSSIQLENDLNSSELANNLSIVCLINKDKQQKQQKIINRLSKKLKDDDRCKCEVTNSIVKLTCKPVKQIANLASTTAKQTQTDNLIQFKVSIDGIIYDKIKYLQVSSYWQMMLNSNEITSYKSNKQLKYLNLVLP